LENSTFEKSGTTLETIYEANSENTIDEPEWAIEVSYEGSYELSSKVLEDISELDLHFSQLGTWVSSSLVALGDLSFEFLNE